MPEPRANTGGEPRANAGDDRRRRRARRPAGTPAPAPTAAAPPTPPPDPTELARTRPEPETTRPDRSERQWRELAGTGKSQVSRSQALRARDVDRPTPEEYAEAEAGLVLQRRHWRPPPT